MIDAVYKDCSYNQSGVILQENYSKIKDIVNILFDDEVSNLDVLKEKITYLLKKEKNKSDFNKKLEDGLIEILDNKSFEFKKINEKENSRYIKIYKKPGGASKNSAVYFRIEGEKIESDEDFKKLFDLYLIKDCDPCSTGIYESDITKIANILSDEDPKRIDEFEEPKGDSKQKKIIIKLYLNAIKNIINAFNETINKSDSIKNIDLQSIIKVMLVNSILCNIDEKLENIVICNSENSKLKSSNSPNIMIPIDFGWLSNRAPSDNLWNGTQPRRIENMRRVIRRMKLINDILNGKSEDLDELAENLRTSLFGYILNSREDYNDIKKKDINDAIKSSNIKKEEVQVVLNDIFDKKKQKEISSILNIIKFTDSSVVKAIIENLNFGFK